MLSILVEIENRASAFKAGLFNSIASASLPNTDPEFGAIAMRRRPGFAGGASFAINADEIPDTVVVRSRIASLEDAAKLKEQPGVVNVYSDPQIAYFPSVDCNSSVASASAKDIAIALGVDRLWQLHDTRGEGTIIGIVDGGVNGSIFPVTGGWSPSPAFPPGSSPVAWNGHGNMCAFDALIACPKAKIYDYSIGRTPGNITALLSSALAAFEAAIISSIDGNGPHVLSNSWGLYQQNWDPFPPGHPSNFTHNMNHPFNRKVLEAMDQGILVAFAAGNCGEVCADGRCGVDVGPGRSIRGANGLARTICVGAASIHRDWVGYSSQGPSTLDLEKPDICGYTHFQGHTPCDNGTSAACPVVAGVLGLLHSIDRTLTQDRARAALRSTAVHPMGQHFDARYGRGVVDAFAAAHHLV